MLDPEYMGFIFSKDDMKILVTPMLPYNVYDLGISVRSVSFPLLLKMFVAVAE